jgi:hypothetical protein
MVFKRKFKDDVETKGELKKYGKEGSKKEEFFDKKERFAKGGAVDPRVAAMMAARMQQRPMPSQGGQTDPRVAAMMAARMQQRPMPSQGGQTDPRVAAMMAARRGPPPGMAKGGSVDKAQEKEHASTLARIAKQESAEAAKMKRGGGVKKYAAGGTVKKADGGIMRGTGAATKGLRWAGMTGLKKGGKC